MARPLGRSGLSMIETVLGFTLVALAGLALLNLLPTVLLSTRLSQQRLQAAGLAQSLLDERRQGKLDPLASYQCDPVNLDSTMFYPTLWIDTVAGKPALRKLRVEVQWVAPGGRRQTLNRHLTVCRLPR